MSAEEINTNINCLTKGQKYKLLVDHFVPSSNFPFPRVFSAGCNRSFLVRWLEKYPWLVYSKTLDVRKFCTLFVKDRSKLGVLVNKPT